MNKLFLTSFFFLLSLIASAQSKQYIRADSVYIQRESGNGELILLNGTRNIKGGLLTNIGGGRTAFIKARVLNDTTLIIGGDTLVINGKAATTLTPNDVWLTAADENIIDSSYTSDGYSMTSYEKYTIPQAIGKRIRVMAGGIAVDTLPDSGTWWFTFNNVTGTLKIFSGATRAEIAGDTPWRRQIIIY